MKITKEAGVIASGAPDAQQLEKINRFAKSRLRAEEVYVFAVRLCDDQPDRDNERFSPECIQELAELFVGKTGVIDHTWSAEKQVARIFQTATEHEAGVMYLKAWAYMLRGEADELIHQIEGGIKKEVSVGCSMGRQVCSICGAEGGCQHVKGQQYGGKLCFTELREPLDAYEWSFVAVPAQRGAGVLKRYGQEDRQTALLHKQAALGQKYLKELRREVVRLAMLADDGLDGGVFAAAADRLEEPELLELKRAYEKQAARRFPAMPQLRDREVEQRGDETVFLV